MSNRVAYSGGRNVVLKGILFCNEEKRNGHSHFEMYNKPYDLASAA
jgi:hypothetical protein